jgi:hypothetical protein
VRFFSQPPPTRTFACAFVTPPAFLPPRFMYNKARGKSPVSNLSLSLCPP